MKKLILPLLLVVGFLFAGFNKANANAVTLTTNNTNALAATTTLNSQLNVVLYSFGLKNTSGTTQAANSTFTFTSGTSNINAGTSTINLYRSTNAVFPGTGTATLVGTFGTTAVTTFTITNTATIPATTQYYYFLVETFTQPTTAGAYTFSLTGVGGGLTTASTLPITGNAYSWSAAITVTLTSLKTPGVNGLAFNPLSTNMLNTAIYGFSLTGGAGTTSATIPQIVFHETTGTIYNTLQTTMTLWSSPTSTLNLNTATSVATYNSTTGDIYATFNPATPISVAPGATTYYFLTLDEPYNGQLTTELDYYSAVCTITPGAQTTGFSYTIGTATVPTITAANDVAGLNPVSGGTIYTGTSGYALAGLSLKTNAGTANVSNITFNYTISGGGSFGSYFATPQLYSSTSATFSTATATAVTASATTVGTSTISFDLPNTTPTFGTTATYYYLVLNYNGAGATPATVTFTPGTYTTSTYNDKPVTVNYTPVNTYTCGTPGPYVLTLSSLTSSANTDGLAATPIGDGSTNFAVYGFSLVGSGTTAGTSSISSLTFTQNGSSTDFNNAYYTTAYLYSSTSSTYGSGTTTLLATTASTNSHTIVFTPSTAIAASNTTNNYYFIVLSNTLGDANTSTFSLAYTSSTVTGTAITPATTAPAVQGPAYTFAALPVSVTLTSFKTPGVNGLAYNPISTTVVNPAVYGFSLTGGSTGVAASITSITLNNPTTGGASPNFYEVNSVITLWSSPTSTFNLNTATQLSQVGVTTGTTTTTFTPATAISVAANSTSYYFVTYDATYYRAAYGTTEQDYSSSTGSPITAGTQTTGYLYTIANGTANPTITAADNTAGLNPVSGGTIYTGTSGYALAGISLKSSGTSNVSNITFNYTISGGGSFGSYFATPQLYSSTSATFSTATATAVTASATTVGTSTISFDLPNTTPTFGTTATYYYLVLNYNGAGATPATVTFTPGTYTTSTYNDKPVTVNYTPVNTYTCGTPGPYVLTLSSLTSSANTDGLAATPIGDGSTNFAVYGFSLVGSGTTAGTSSISSLTFTQNGSSTDFNNAYYTTAYLYSSTSSTYGSGTTTLLATTASTNSHTIVFTPSTAIAASNTTNNYYFIVLSNTLGDHNTNTFALTYTSSTVTGTAITPATTAPAVQGPAYTFAATPPYTYYWTGAQQTTNPSWTNPNNWETTFTALGGGTNAGQYPGATPTDNAIFNEACFSTANATAIPSVSTNLNFNALSVYGVNTAGGTYYNTTVSLTVNSADSVTVASVTEGIAAGNGAKINTLNVYGTASGGNIASLRVTGATNLYNNAYFFPFTNSVVNFPSGSSINMVGTTTRQPEFIVQGGLVTTNNCAISLAPNTTVLGGIFANGNGGGSMSINGGSVITMNGQDPEFINDNNLYLNSSTLSMGGVDPYTDFYEGIVNTNNSSILLTSSFGDLEVDAGTVTMLGSTLTFTGSDSEVDFEGGTFNFGGTTSANASTMNFGTSTTTGIDGELYNGGGTFNLNAYSTINLIGVDDGAYPNIENNGGIFICASTSTINPTSTTSNIDNSNRSANDFTFLSDANGSATIGTMGTGGQITGQYNVQRYISTASRNYRLLATQVNTTAYTPGTAGSPNKANMLLLDETATIPTTPAITYPGAYVGGPAGTAGGFTATTGGPCLYLYDEAIMPSPVNFNTSYYAGKNIAITKLTTTYVSTQSTALAVGGTTTSTTTVYNNNDNGNSVIVPPGNGYLLYYIHDNTSTVATSAINTTAITGSGYINQGTIPMVRWGANGATTSALTINTGTAGSPAYPGLTMVGNPYPSAIDLEKVYSDNTIAGGVFNNGTNGSFSELNPTNEQFVTFSYNGSSALTNGTNASEYISSGQGFYITVQNAGGTLTFYENQKVPNTTSFPVLEGFPTNGKTVDNINHIGGSAITADAFIPSAKTNDAMLTNKGPRLNTLNLLSDVLSVSSAPHRKPTVGVLAPPSNTPPAVTSNGPAVALAGLHLKLVKDTVNYDECGLYFSKTWSDKFDRNDAMDLDGTAGQVYLSSYSSDDVRTTINALGDYTGGKQVKLFVKLSTAGIYQLQMPDISNFDTADYSVFLLDKLKADSLDLTLYKSYNFNYAPGTANDSTRFVLAIEHKPVPYYALLAFAGQKVTPGVQLNWQTKNLGNKTTFILQKLNASNLYVSIDSLESDSSGEFNYIDQHPTLGNNTYRLEQINELGNITYSAPVTIGYNSTNPNGGLVLYPNPAKTTMTVTLTTSSVAVQVATADIYNTSGKLIEHKVVNSNSFVHDVSGYALGAYIIELKNSNGVLVGNSKFVKVN